MVRVTPTGDWVYWGLGGLALLVLALGIVRSLRNRPSHAGSRPLPPSTPGSSTPGSSTPAAPGPVTPRAPESRDERATTEAS
jgi:hypothetical protein